MNKLTLQAPNREWYRTETGLWASRRWTQEAIDEYRAAGAWFGEMERDTELTPREDRDPDGKNCGWRCQVHKIATRT